MFALLITPFSIKIARYFGAMDRPDPRKVHSYPMPRWGGTAIVISFLLAISALWWSFPRFKILLAYRHKFTEAGQVIDILSMNHQLMGILVGALVVLVLGMIDDSRGVSPIPKLLTQIIAAYVAMVYGVRITGLTLPFFEYTQFPIFFSQVITALWIIGFMNAVNLADGLDGLAAGLVAIASGTFLIVAILQGNTKVILFAKQLKLTAILSAAVCGASLGFLFYNFFPAKVFMGDGGALALGFLLGTITVIGTLKTTAVIALFIPIMVIALPVADVAFTIYRRIKSKASVMQADGGHVHHKMLSMGWTQREVVLLMYVLSLLLSISAILLTVFKGQV